MPRLVAAIAVAAHAQPVAAAPATIELAYPARLEALLTAPAGRRYRAILSPWADANGHITHIHLDLLRSPRHRGRGLLEPPGDWRGMQPFYFLAADLAGGGGGSHYGHPRIIALTGTNEALEVRVLQTRVRPTGSAPGYEFDALRLALRVLVLARRGLVVTAASTG